MKVQKREGRRTKTEENIAVSGSVSTDVFLLLLLCLPRAFPVTISLPLFSSF